ncbi:MAG TPA: DUF4230 domain-containing protein [Mycobacteriales bacterium]|nr:DUF4230 domain-containing protein [Mycobacteriales bacterium]
MKRAVTWTLALILVFIAGSLATNLASFRNLFDSLLNQRTYVATGDVVLKRLREKKTFVAATGTFEVPVVVCDGSPRSYNLRDDPDDEGRTPAQQLLEACNGLLDSKATLLASAEVDAFIDLGKLGADDISVTGETVNVRLPTIEFSEPRIDAERGLSVIAKKGSVPIIGGDLPEDYQAQAAGEAKAAIARLASQSGLPELGARSATDFFESLLTLAGFADARVTIELAPRT